MFINLFIFLFSVDFDFLFDFLLFTLLNLIFIGVIILSIIGLEKNKNERKQNKEK